MPVSACVDEVLHTKGQGLGLTNDVHRGASTSGTVECVGEVECRVILTSKLCQGGDSTQAPRSVVPDRVP